MNVPSMCPKRNDIENQCDKRREAIKGFMVHVIKLKCYSFWRYQDIHMDTFEQFCAGRIIITREI